MVRHCIAVAALADEERLNFSHQHPDVYLFCRHFQGDGSLRMHDQSNKCAISGCPYCDTLNEVLLSLSLESTMTVASF